KPCFRLQLRVWRTHQKALRLTRLPYTTHFRSDSIHTRVQKFDEHMKSADIFEVEKFPEASFKSTSIEKTGDKTGKVIGDLTIKRSEEHTSELQSRESLVCRLLLEKKKRRGRDR